MGKGDTHTKRHTKSRFVKYELEIAKKDEGEFYAKVVGVLNGNRIKVIDVNGIEYQVGIRGNFYFGSKKENLNFTDIERHEYWVLIQSGISKNQYFLKHIYSDTDQIKLQDRGELNQSIVKTNIIELTNDVEVEIDDGEDWLENI